MESVIQEEKFLEMADQNGKLVLILPMEEVDWIESIGSNVRVHCGAEYTLKTSISALERRLDEEKFVRIHRCTIVNVDRVRSVEPSFYGNYEVVLTNGTKLTLSRKDKLPQLKKESLSLVEK